MRLVVTELSTAIITAAITEVDRCRDIEGNFDPSLFNKEFYLNVLYSFLLSRIEVSVNYTGTIPEVGPDPATGVHKFKLISLGNSDMVSPGTGTGYSTVFPQWWTSLFNSLIMNTNLVNSDLASGVTLTTTSSLTGFPSTPIAPVVSDIRDIDGGKKGFEQIWEKFSESIINGLEAMTVSNFTIPTANVTSSNGGTGAIVPISVTVNP